ncbi:hypothetical protein [Crocosphaera chwakensis]|uniref:Uncharacterized protein n=1 Tax=Crocosphaera chwakensis CCY0110 TaxID=391612 RepID=A3IK28_9CHRO|nr:hypothetical protein [Crocosphaera chwakensis]EAZ93017.1 hypothetical protein CY0110_03074 [Crocosphaera chwakensis CCY0110]
MSKQANKLVGNNIKNLIVSDAILDLDDGFYAGDERRKQRGREDELIGISGVSLNPSSASITTFSSNAVPIIPEVDQEEDIIRNEEENVLFISSTSKGFRGQGKEKSFDITPEYSSDTHQDSESEDSIGGPPVSRGPSSDHSGEESEEPKSMAGPPIGRGSSSDHGGGEPEETFGNNLSFPVIWSEGVSKVLRGAIRFSETYTYRGIESIC